MPQSTPSKGSQLLALWRAERNAKTVGEILELHASTYSRLENGIRKPAAEVAARIEERTRGMVTARSWYEDPAPKLARRIDRLRATA